MRKSFNKKDGRAQIKLVDERQSVSGRVKARIDQVSSELKGDKKRRGSIG